MLGNADAVFMFLKIFEQHFRNIPCGVTTARRIFFSDYIEIPKMENVYPR